MRWYFKVLRNYAGFNGRARREEYWMFTLFHVIATIIAAILDGIFGLTLGDLPYGLFYFSYALAVFIPGLAVTVRRLHDINKSGWMMLVALIPLVGSIWLLVLLATNSDANDNQFGENPKETLA